MGQQKLSSGTCSSSQRPTAEGFPAQKIDLCVEDKMNKENETGA